MKPRVGWPTMKTARIKSDFHGNLLVDATVDLDDRACVDVAIEIGATSLDLSAAEAERLGIALLKAASVVRAKEAFVRGARSKDGGSR